jgi:hypothetical protein
MTCFMKEDAVQEDIFGRKVREFQNSEMAGKNRIVRYARLKPLSELSERLQIPFVVHQVGTTEHDQSRVLRTIELADVIIQVGDQGEWDGKRIRIDSLFRDNVETIQGGLDFTQILQSHVAEVRRCLFVDYLSGKPHDSGDGLAKILQELGGLPKIGLSALSDADKCLELPAELE